MLNLKRFAVFSLMSLNDINVDSEGYRSSYRMLHIQATLKDKKLEYKVVKGSYKGTLETSILVVCDTDDKLNWVREVAFADGQDSILIVSEDRKAYLEYNQNIELPSIQGIKVTGPKIESLGDFRAISALEAKELDAWTLDETESQYYACL